MKTDNQMTERIKNITEKLHEMNRLIAALHNEVWNLQSENSKNIKSGYIPYYKVLAFFDEFYPHYKAKNRQSESVIARQVIMFILRNNSAMTFKAIGRLLNGLDHTTVIHSCTKVTDLLHIEDAAYTEMYNHAINYLCENMTTSSTSLLLKAS